MTASPPALALARRSAKAMYEADAASRALGIEIGDVGPGRAQARMTITPAMVNGHGIAHGGCEISFLRPAREGHTLTAVAAERTRNGRTGIYDVSVTGPDDAAVAELRGHSSELKEAQ